ncbi:MAG: alpha/beta hydrolase [Bacteroidales bacterium]|nr:alpha/beta hydrolase [Bacteroidales bacterium]MDD4670807.1 alpha/beta hydrolase [Bacteroidales bacterium]
MIYSKSIINSDATEWVVFVHGAGGSSNVWFRQIRDFGRKYNLLLIDLRGHGESAKIKHKDNAYNRYTISEIAKDVVEVLQSMNLTQCHLVGLSLGGIVIREIAETHIELVKSMTMAGAVIKFSPRSKFLSWIANATKHIFPYMWIYRIYARVLMPSKHNRESRKVFIAESLKVTRQEFLNWMTVNKGLNKVLSKYWDNEPEVPTLYIMGENDYIFISQVKMYMQTHCQHSRLIILPNAGHVCNIEAAGLFNKIVLEYLKSVDDGTVTLKQE